MAVFPIEDYDPETDTHYGWILCNLHPEGIATMADAPTQFFTLNRERDTKNTVLFVSPDPNATGVKNIYLGKELVQELGDPQIIVITVGPATPTSPLP